MKKKEIREAKKQLRKLFEECADKETCVVLGTDDSAFTEEQGGSTLSGSLGTTGGKVLCLQMFLSRLCEDMTAGQVAGICVATCEAIAAQKEAPTPGSVN